MRTPASISSIYGRIFLVNAILLVATACSGDPPGPKPIAAGEDVCNLCRMMIDYPDQAAEIVETDGTVRKFDNPVCALRYLDLQRQRNRDYPIVELYLADYPTKEFIPAGAAWIARGEMTTAMGYGILAFRERETAERVAAEHNGKVITFKDVRLTFGEPEAVWEVTLSEDGLDPDHFQVMKDKLVEVRVHCMSDNLALQLQGYPLETDLLSKGQWQTLRFIADFPGDDFGLYLLPEKRLAGKFSVLGEHFEGEPS